MEELVGNIWRECIGFDALCVTTNGVVKKNGDAVMGKGIALEAKERFPTLPTILGRKLASSGNNVHYLCHANVGAELNSVALISFPTKHHWRERASLELIKRSAYQLVKLADKNGWEKIILPRPGCGNGGLVWATEVRPVLEPVLDDRFHVIGHKPEVKETRVVHCKRAPYDVYIGRPSKWGNPFSHKPGTQAKYRVATREEAIRAYEEWIKTQPHLLADLKELRGKTLGCWCKPLPCHGDVLARLANEPVERPEGLNDRPIIAIIGTREPDENQQALCTNIARAFRDLGCDLVTGNAVGIDSIARDVWNEEHPERVTLVLPWPGYNTALIHKRNQIVVFAGQRDWLESVRAYHPAPGRLKESMVKLHARNYGIVEIADTVVALPRITAWGMGGTGQGVRIAQALGKRLFVLPEDLEALRNYYRERKEMISGV